MASGLQWVVGTKAAEMDMADASLPISGDTPRPAVGKAAAAEEPSFFHELLSELNPLQYLPVVGTIYRAVTGDTIPEAARVAGSMVVSGLMGGPIGVALNIGMTMLEHAIDVDPEKIGTDMLAAIGIGGPASMPGAPEGVAVAQDEPAAPARQAWTPAQLQAYGISSTADGALTRGSIVGADVLNGMELSRLSLPLSQAAAMV